MKIENNVVLNFSLNSEEEAEFLRCFLTDDALIVFPFKESWLNHEEEDLYTSSERKDFILSRTIAVSKNQVIYWLPKDDESVYWYSPKDSNELESLIEENYYDYVCIILEKGKGVKDYTYLLSIEESYPFTENNTCRALLVHEKIKDSFKDKVIPKIKEKFRLNFK